RGLNNYSKSRCVRAMRTSRTALFLCVVLAAACKKQTASQEQPSGGTAPAGQTAAPSADAIRVGATLPLTGAEARTGGFYKEGYELAFEEATKNGGVDVGGKKMAVQLTLLDDTSTQATAASLADRLINSDKVNFLLGTYATNLVEAQSVVAEQNQIPYVNGGGAATAIYKRGYQWVFGLPAPVELLGKVKAANTDLFLADAHLPDYITMQRQYVTAGMCHKIQSYGARGSEKQAAESLTPKNVQYILSAVWWSNQLSSKSPEAKRFVDLFKSKY